MNFFFFYSGSSKNANLYRLKKKSPHLDFSLIRGAKLLDFFWKLLSNQEDAVIY